MTLTGVDEPVQLRGVRASAPFFDILGVKPALGRTFAPDEDQPGKEQVVVLSHRIWESRFGADPGVIGRKIHLDKNQQVWIDAVGMLMSINMMSQFLPTPYSPFYEDKVHPKFVERALGLIEAARSSKGMDETIRAHITFLAHALSRQLRTSRDIRTEIVTPYPLTDATFDRDGFLVIGDRNSKYSQIQRNVFEGVPDQVRSNVVLAETRSAILSTLPDYVE